MLGLLTFFRRARIGWMLGLASCMLVVGGSTKSMDRPGENAAAGGAAKSDNGVLLSPRVPSIIPAMFGEQQSDEHVEIKVES